MAWLVKKILDWLSAKIVAWAEALVLKFKHQEAVKKEAGDSVDPLKKANPESEKAIDEAIPKSLDGF